MFNSSTQLGGYFMVGEKSNFHHIPVWLAQLICLIPLDIIRIANVDRELIASIEAFE